MRNWLRHLATILTVTTLIVNGMAAFAYLQPEVAAGQAPKIPQCIDPSNGNSAWFVNQQAQCDLTAYCDGVSQQGDYCGSYTCKTGLGCGANPCGCDRYNGTIQYGSCQGAPGSTAVCNFCPQYAWLYCAYGTSFTSCIIVDGVPGCEGTAGCDWIVYTTSQCTVVSG